MFASYTFCRVLRFSSGFESACQLASRGASGTGICRCKLQSVEPRTTSKGHWSRTWNLNVLSFLLSRNLTPLEENGARGPHHAQSPLHALQPHGCNSGGVSLRLLWGRRLLLRQGRCCKGRLREVCGSCFMSLFGSKLPATPPAGPS